MEQSSFEKALKAQKSTLKRRLKTLKKSLNSSLKQLALCNDWEKKQHEADLLQSNLYQIKKGAKEISIEDWNTGQLVHFNFDPKIPPAQEVAKRYKTAKKLKLGLPYVEKGVKKINEDLLRYENLVLELEKVATEEELKQFIEKHAPPKPQTKVSVKAIEPPKPFWEYFSESKISIWVGKNAKQNDALTFRHAHGNDYWLHLSDEPGSHVVIHLGRNEVDEETLKDALQLALYHSKARHKKEGDVSLTQVKFVRKFGKEKGKVTIANEKRHFVRLDQKRMERLIHSSSLKR